MKKIPIGVENFKEIITNNYYYVDKTKFIEEILNDGSKIKLFTRPRRFGKTLNMSMLKYFFDIENKEENKKIFKDLYIEKTEAFKEQGQYPVIFLSLKDLKALTWEQMEKAIKSAISRLFSEYKYLLNDLDKFDTLTFENILLKNTELEDLKEALKFLTRILYEKYNKKVVVLIDEYDSPLVSAYINGYYEKAKDFFKTFYSSVLKDNNYLQMGVLTGIIRVIKAGIFSDLNNLRTYTILSDDYTDSYGLTEEEVEKSLKDYGIEQEISNVKDWYDGYKFGDSEVYNPWSILNFLQDKELRAYWVNTSDNALIYENLSVANMDVFNCLEKLFEGKEIKKEISPFFTFEELSKFDGIWQLMVYNGYLKLNQKLEDDEYLLTIPNYEIQTFFKKGFIDKYLIGSNYFNPIMRTLLEGNIDEFGRMLEEIFLINTSFHDLKAESVYHTFLLGMLIWLRDKYEVKSNGERGQGRYDILLLPLDKKKPAFVFEFKVSKTIKGLESKAEEALNQIKEKQYDIGIKESGIDKIYRIGLAFRGKKVKIKYELA